MEKADSKLLKLLGIQPKMPGFHILSQMPAQHNKINVPVEELSMQRPSELKQDFDWYYTNTAKGSLLKFHLIVLCIKVQERVKCKYKKNNIFVKNILCAVSCNFYKKVYLIYK